MSDDVKKFLAGYIPDVQESAMTLRSIILETLPGVREKVHPGWRVIAYGYGPKMKEQILGIAPLQAGVSVYFMHSALLPDPKGILRGAKGSARHLKFGDGVVKFDLRQFKSLIKAAAGNVKKLNALGGTAGAKKTAGGAKAPSGIGDEAVKEKTGKTWKQWFAILENAGAARMTHKEIVAYLSAKHGIGAWWRQMVAVSYEQAHGARAKHETPMGYQSSVSKTVNAPVAKLFAAMNDAKMRARWLPKASMTIRKATPYKSIRVSWESERSNMDVRFSAKGAEKSQIVVDQKLLKSAAEVKRMKKFWGERLNVLKGMLEK